MNRLQLSDADARHFETVLELNEQFVQFLSPLDAKALSELDQTSGYFRVFEMDGEVVAFLIAFFPAANYDSPNYLWFDKQEPDFVYVDRIVVSNKARGLSLGTKLYDDLSKYAREHGFKRITCEYNIRPMNEGSAKFHQRYGFEEIGQQELPGGKVVSLQAYALP